WGGGARRLVVGKARGRCAEGVLHPRNPARRPRDRELRPLPAADQDPAQGAQGRLAPVRAQLLPPLPPGRAPRRAGRHLHQPRRLPLCDSRRENAMSSRNDREETRRKDGAIDRRSILLGGTTLAAASALAAGTS